MLIIEVDGSILDLEEVMRKDKERHAAVRQIC
jgi:hypothetical protein